MIGRGAADSCSEYDCVGSPEYRTVDESVNGVVWSGSPSLPPFLLPFLLPLLAFLAGAFFLDEGPALDEEPEYCE